MEKEQLAIFGGQKTIKHPMSPYVSFGYEEIEAGKKVLDSGILSAFFGSWSEQFFGGHKVQEFEAGWRQFFETKHAVSVNSATSGLIAAIGALAIEPGDEVIVSPWTMSASATAILVWNAIPVFADIEAETFNLDPNSIRQRITARTRAIVVPDIFGHAANMTEIIEIAKQHGLYVIEDASQAPGAKYKGKFVGTWADIGVFSLNYHKHIHTGEGGVCVTNDDRLAERMQLIRNHAEAVAGAKGETDFSNLIGFNFRLGEIEAAIGIEQLKKLPAIAAQRHAAGLRLNAGLQKLEGLRVPTPQNNCTHVYYVYGLQLMRPELVKRRQAIAAALTAEGVEGIRIAYLNIHLLPMYQQRIAYGKKGYPWKNGEYESTITYQKGICPVAEELQDHSYLGFYFGGYALPDNEIDLIISAFEKVWQGMEYLQ
jgi:perosamine synthetase